VEAAAGFRKLRASPVVRSYHNAAVSSRPCDSTDAGRKLLRVIHSNSSNRLASACHRTCESRYKHRGTGRVPHKMRIRSEGAGGDAGPPMAIITCAIIDLVAIALFLGLCAFVCL
jgi:hypothetical protein